MYLCQVVVFGQQLFYSTKLFNSSKSCCIRTNCLYSREMVVIEQRGCIRAKVFLFVQKVVVFEQSVCARAKVVVLGQGGCIRELFVLFSKVVLFEKKLLYSDKKLIFG